jgi:hypothetical protein
MRFLGSGSATAVNGSRCIDRLNPGLKFLDETDG